ncbi:hypothetical protein HO173_007882 [Letharia columbiana]|uniref:Uncharacterized protein n=1 Tax=Letharia columbiana TaxID=112416 RepID=A0A8H6FST9_9LECA|nr:uncharacterized protein HO173_007882 [Letharia columbiana]KAF6234052.1 hypothetical protein HO173_007882 [Letharia columbiana]
MPTFHIILIFVYTLGFLFLSYNSVRPNTPGMNLVFSPLNEALIPEKKMVHATLKSKNPFKGPPSPELDDAWHQLFVNSNVRVSADDLQKINRTSVPLGDGSGYYAIPDVYHQLHCLKFLRQMLYHDYYRINKPTNPIHIDHCIDNLRQNLMCKADVSLLTFDWVSNDRAPKPNFDIQHECKNWESIDAWAEDHAFNIFDETILVHPTLGPSFPEAEFKNTGKIPGHPGFLHEHGGMVE